MATSRKSRPLPRDPSLKAIFSHPRMIADALRGYAVYPHGPIDPRIVAALDFDTLEKLPTEWITDDFRRRIGDDAWRVRFRWAKDWSDPAGYLLILVEFQSQWRSDMAQRMARYAQLVYDEMEITGGIGTPRPLVLPLVIYNGPGRWTAATTLNDVIAVPAAANSEDARRVAHGLAPFQPRHAHFVLDFHYHRQDDPRADNAMSLLIGLESASTWDELWEMLHLLGQLPERRLAATMLEWSLLRLRVNIEMAEEMKKMAGLDQFQSQLEERAKGWRQQLIAEGVEQGIEQGRTEGERSLLRRFAEHRFGASAEPLYPLLDQVRSSAKLEEIGEWLMADTIDQLIAKVEIAIANDRIH